MKNNKNYYSKKKKTLLMKKTWFGTDGRSRKGRGFFRYKMDKQLIVKNKKMHEIERERYENYNILFSEKREKLERKIKEKLKLPFLDHCSHFKRKSSKERYFLQRESEIIIKKRSIISRLSGKMKKNNALEPKKNHNFF